MANNKKARVFIFGATALQEIIDLYDRSVVDESLKAKVALYNRDYSAAATACHRALQFERQASTVRKLMKR